MITNRKQKKLNSYLMLGELFENYDIFFKYMKSKGFLDSQLNEDWYNYIFIAMRNRRSMYINIEFAYFDLVIKWRSLVTDLENIAEIQRNFNIQDALLLESNRVRLPYSTNDLGEEEPELQFQLIGKEKNLQTIKSNLMTYSDRMGSLLGLHGDKTQLILNRFIKSISNILQ